MEVPGMPGLATSGLDQRTIVFTSGTASVWHIKPTFGRPGRERGDDHFEKIPPQTRCGLTGTWFSAGGDWSWSSFPSFVSRYKSARMCLDCVLDLLDER